MKKKNKKTIVNKESYVIEFGKHKGKTVGWVMHEDPTYIFWLHRKNIIEFSEGILDALAHMPDNDVMSNRFMDIGDFS